MHQKQDFYLGVLNFPESRISLSRHKWVWWLHTAFIAPLGHGATRESGWDVLCWMECMGMVQEGSTTAVTLVMDCRPWPLHGSAYLTSCSVPMHTISPIFPVWRQCISSVTQFLCCIGVTQTTYVVLPIFQKAFSLKAVSPFIAHRAATITIPLSSFFRDVEWQGREVRSFRAQQGQWWVEDATFHSKLAARCPSIIACSSSIPFSALFNSLPALAHFMFWETNLLRWSSIFFAKFAIGTFRSSSSALFFRFLLAVS